MKGILSRLGTVLALFISIVIIDFIWFSVVAGDWLAESIGYIRAVPLLPLIYAGWLIVAFAFWYLVVQHAKEPKLAVLEGGLFGLLIYSVHSLTNYAVLQGYPGLFTVVDMIWGSLFFGVLALVYSLIMRRKSKKLK